MDLLVIAVIVLIIVLAVRYIVKSKKQGNPCIGCTASCDGKCPGCK
jgi:hypothetical protein